MSFVIIDRRKNGKGKSTDNRFRFFRKFKEDLRKSLKDLIVNGSSIKDIVSDDGPSKEIRIPRKGLKKPSFVLSRHGGKKHIVIPGNDVYVTGDRIRRPESQEGEGGGASNEGEGEDEFSFHMTKDEFNDLFFEDLELPNMDKSLVQVTEEYKTRRCGFSTDGNKMNIMRTMRQGAGRRIALKSKKKKRLAELEVELYDLMMVPEEERTAESIAKIALVTAEMDDLKRRIGRVAFVDDVDLRFNQWVRDPVPTTKAVMFCLMDVSASMGEREKDLARRFFMLLYYFLTRTYEKVEIVYIRHTQIAKEVNEEEFFHSRKTGGTVVSSGLEEIDKIVKSRFPLNEWNIYGCQASDGDNWVGDSNICVNLLSENILPVFQYYAYIEIPLEHRQGQTTELWDKYSSLKSKSNFDMASISKPADIWKVFHGLFEKRKKV